MGRPKVRLKDCLKNRMDDTNPGELSFHVNKAAVSHGGYHGKREKAE